MLQVGINTKKRKQGVLVILMHIWAALSEVSRKKTLEASSERGVGHRKASREGRGEEVLGTSQVKALRWEGAYLFEKVKKAARMAVAQRNAKSSQRGRQGPDSARPQKG